MPTITNAADSGDLRTYLCQVLTMVRHLKFLPASGLVPKLSIAVAYGASLFILGKVLDHKNARTTEVYAHLRDDPMLEVGDRAAARIAAALEGKSAEVIPITRSA